MNKIGKEEKVTHVIENIKKMLLELKMCMKFKQIAEFLLI